MRKLILATATLCAVALSGSMASAGDLTPAVGESQAIGGVPTGGNQAGQAVRLYRADVSVANEGRSARHMRRHRARKMMMKSSSGAAPGGAKAGVGGMGMPATK